MTELVAFSEGTLFGWHLSNDKTSDCLEKMQETAEGEKEDKSIDEVESREEKF